MFYPQGSDKNGNQSNGQEGERRESEEVEEMGAEWQEGEDEATTGDTLAAKVSKFIF